MINLTTAKPNHIDQIFAIETEAFGGDAYTKSSMKYQIKSPSNYFIVLEDDNKIVGYITIRTRKNNKTMRLYNFAVHKDYRGKGYAKELFTVLLNLLQLYNKAYLEVKVTNTPAIKFYKKNGFQIEYEIPFYYHDGSSAYKMSLTV